MQNVEAGFSLFVPISKEGRAQLAAMLTNGEIYELSKTLSFDELVKRVQLTQPALDAPAIKAIVKGVGSHIVKR